MKFRAWLFALLLVFLALSASGLAQSVQFDISGSRPIAPLALPSRLFQVTKWHEFLFPKKELQVFPPKGREYSLDLSFGALSPSLSFSAKRKETLSLGTEPQPVPPLQGSPDIGSRDLSVPLQKRTLPFPEIAQLPPALPLQRKVEVVSQLPVFPPKRGGVFFPPYFELPAKREREGALFPDLPPVPFPRSKTDAPWRTTLEIGTNQLLVPKLSLQNPYFSFSLDSLADIQGSVLLGNTVFAAKVNPRGPSFLLENDISRWRVFSVDGTGGAQWLQKSWPFAAVDSGVHLFGLRPLPLLHWYPGTAGRVMLGLDEESLSSYGGRFMLYYSPLQLDVFSGYDFSGEHLRLSAKGWYHVPALHARFFATLGYAQSLDWTVGIQVPPLSVGLFHLGAEGFFGYKDADWVSGIDLLFTRGFLGLHFVVKRWDGGWEYGGSVAFRF
ncbi:MAG TPA: hypothetical protein P5560_08745 [Thermotogota bacterium]|nr:hypothetical protein [Thermotogota bacterium]